MIRPSNTHHIGPLSSVFRRRVSGGPGRFRQVAVVLALAVHLPVMEATHDQFVGQFAGLEPLLSVEDLSGYLGVPVQTIYDWRVHGKGPPAYRIGESGVLPIGTNPASGHRACDASQSSREDGGAGHPQGECGPVEQAPPLV